MTPQAAEALRLAAETPVIAGAGDLDAAANDLAAAFSDYPMFRWWTRTDARRGPALLDFFRLVLAETGYTAGEIQRPAVGGAAAVWLASEQLRPAPLWTELRALPTLLALTGFSRFGRLLAVRNAMDRRHPMERPHAYLWMLGVRPEAQGQGVGSRLLAAGLRQVDAVGRPAFLETSSDRNVGLYRRHGFEVISTFHVAPGAPQTWAMWREPRA